jgi:predicted O-methyltransferase YrrM
LSNLWEDVDRYFEERLVRDDHAVETGGLPRIEVTPTQGKLLHVLARAVGARAILELGTLGGYSTIWLARALPNDGRLVTIEVDPGYAELARRNIDSAGVGERVELVVGDAAAELARVAGPFDLIFIDADKRSNAVYLEHALRLSRPGTLIVADNVVRDGAVIDAVSEDESVLGVRAFTERLADEPRVTATAVQTVGTKGHDGFVVALVTA